jgi:hypothetical protein
MRPARLLAVAVLAVVLVGLSLTALRPAFAQPPSGQVGFGKACISKPTDAADVMFHFAVTEPGNQEGRIDLPCDVGYAYSGVPADVTYVFTELVSENPPGWVFKDITCEQIAGNGQTGWEIEGPSVTIHHDTANDIVFCSFTNRGPSPAVGGVPAPVNTVTILAPWLAVVGLVGCIGTVVVVAKKHQSL